MFNIFINIGNYKWVVFLTIPLYEFIIPTWLSICNNPTLWIYNPNMVINLLCRSFGNALVNTSTTMSFVEQYLNVTLPFLICFRTKWCWTSMCFVRTCCEGFFVNDIAPWLSHQITIAFFSFMYPNSFMSFVIHMVSLVPCVLAMYSASVVNKTIMGCRLLL